MGGGGGGGGGGGVGGSSCSCRSRFFPLTLLCTIEFGPSECNLPYCAQKGQNFRVQWGNSNNSRPHFRRVSLSKEVTRKSQKLSSLDTWQKSLSVYTYTLKLWSLPIYFLEMSLPPFTDYHLHTYDLYFYV